MKVGLCHLHLWGLSGVKSRFVWSDSFPSTSHRRPWRQKRTAQSRRNREVRSARWKANTETKLQAPETKETPLQIDDTRSERNPRTRKMWRRSLSISNFNFFFLLLLLSLSLSLSFCLLPSISVHRRRYPILNGRPRTLLRSMPHHNSISNRNQNIPRGAPPPPVREAARAVTAFEAVTVDDYRPESNFWFIFGSFEAVKFPENRSFAHFLDRKSSHITSPYPLPPFLSLFAYFLPSHPPRCSLLPYKDNIYIKKKQFIDWYLEFLYGICA